MFFFLNELQVVDKQMFLGWGQWLSGSDVFLDAVLTWLQEGVQIDPPKKQNVCAVCDIECEAPDLLRARWLDSARPSGAA